MELGQSTCFPSEGEWIKQWSRVNKTGSIHSPVTWYTRANQRRQLWGHVTSDLWRGCRLVVDMATSGRAAALNVLAWLKHNHTLLTQSQPVWGREDGRALGGCRRLRRHSMTDTHSTCTMAGQKTKWVCTQICIISHIQTGLDKDLNETHLFVLYSTSF